MDLLISIHKRYVDQIRAGEKLYEYRKGAFDKSKVDSVYVYETNPVKRITGRLILGRIISGTPDEVWSKLDKTKVATLKSDFMEYYKGKCRAYAWEVKGFIPFNPPIDPYVKIPGFRPPQSYQYIDYPLEDDTNRIKTRSNIVEYG